MTKKKNTNDDNQAYLVIGIVFLGVALSFIFNDSTRAVAIPFFVMGITFMVISLSDTKTKKKRK